MPFRATVKAKIIVMVMSVVFVLGILNTISLINNSHTKARYSKVLSDISLSYEVIGILDRITLEMDQYVLEVDQREL